MRACFLRLLALPVSLAGLSAAVSPVWGQAPDPLGGVQGGLLELGGRQEQVVTVAAEFTAPTADKPARLFITATIKPGWHIYSITQPSGGPIATKLKLDPPEGFRVLGDYRASPPPEKKREPVFDNLMVESHYGTVTWHVPVELPPGVDPATLKIEGQITAQPCDANSCLPPQRFPFTAVLGPGVKVQEAEPSLEIGMLAVKLGLAFLGGLILNLTPCVLPVISLKILAFLEQAGESRARVFALNLWYAAGLLSVFMVLAALSSSAGFAWGEQFTLPWFKIAMTGLVFVMALSFLGVWEIPIPGFIGSGRAGELQAKEGASGAFFKGVFATILATPCSGPLLGSLFGILLDQPAYVVYLIFGAMGLGMASPYLVIGGFPELIRFLPKPGAWMDTLKQLMGFLLLGTVVYLFSAMTEKYFIPTLTLLMGLWFACWLIGRTPLTAGPRRRAAAWVGGVLTATLVGVVAFTVLLWESIIPWQPFSPEALASARAEGRTVMVDFTADWCPNCKTNLKVAIERREVLELIKKNRVTPLLADWTDRSPVIKKALNHLGANSIPVLAIWPPDGEVIILKDLVTKSQVVNALTRAGPSKPASGARIGQEPFVPSTLRAVPAKGS